MTIQEFINKNFGGNVAMFCRAFKISRFTAYEIMNKGYKRDTILRRKLEKQGVKFDQPFEKGKGGEGDIGGVGEKEKASI